MVWAACEGQGPPPAPILEDQTLRDGLQILPRALPLARRLELFHLLADAGFTSLQVGSLVRPDKMPQMADTERLAELAARRPGLELSALVFNRRGLGRALDCGVGKVALSASLSEPHSRANLGRAVDHGLALAGELAALALAAGLKARVGLQCAFGGPGLPPPPRWRIAQALAWLHGLGVDELYLADTAGLARPGQVAGLVGWLRRRLPGARLGLHLHGPAARLRANMLAGWRAGASRFDVTLAGLGGCPFLPGRPPGNLAAANAVAALASAGLHSPLDKAALATAQRRLRAILGPQGPRRLPL